MLWGQMEVPCRRPCQGKHVWLRRAAASDPLPEQCLQQGPAHRGQEPTSERASVATVCPSPGAGGRRGGALT